MAKFGGVKITKGNLEAIFASVNTLAQTEVLVGFPADTSARDPSADEPIGMTNAELAYIHDNGAPEAHIPARPFMVPGIQAAEPAIEVHLRSALEASMRGNQIKVEGQLIAAGLAAQAGIRGKINEGIPPPLSRRTLEERARKGRKGAKQELANRDKGMPAGTALAKPLIDTAQMRNAVNFAIRKRRTRR